jgi:ribosomal protein S4
MSFVVATKQDICRYYKEDLWGGLALRKNIFLKLNKFLFYKIKKKKFTGNRFEVLKLDNKVFKKKKRLTPKEIRYFHKEKLKIYFLDFDEYSLRNWFLQTKPGKLASGNFYKRKSLRHAIANRLDHLIYTFGWANSIGQAKDYIKKGFIQINNYIPTRINYVPEVGDEIRVRSNLKKKVFRYLISLKYKRLNNLNKINSLRIRYYKYAKRNRKFYLISRRNLKKFKFVKIKQLRLDRLGYLSHHWRFYNNRPTISSIYNKAFHRKKRFKRKIKIPFAFLPLKKFLLKFYRQQLKLLPGFEHKVDLIKKKFYASIQTRLNKIKDLAKKAKSFKKLKIESTRRKKILNFQKFVLKPFVKKKKKIGDALEPIFLRLTKNLKVNLRYFKLFKSYLNIWFLKNKKFLKKNKIKYLKNFNFRRLTQDFFGTRNKLYFYTNPYPASKILLKKSWPNRKFVKKINFAERNFRKFLATSTLAKKIYEIIAKKRSDELKAFVPKPSVPLIDIKESKLILTFLEKRYLASFGRDKPARFGTGYYYSSLPTWTREEEPSLLQTLVRSKLRPYFRRNLAKNKFFDVKFMPQNEIVRRFKLEEKKYLDSLGTDKPTSSGSGFYYFDKGQQKISYIRPYFPNNPIKNDYFSVKCFRDFRNPDHLTDLKWFNKRFNKFTQPGGGKTEGKFTQPGGGKTEGKFTQPGGGKPFPELFAWPTESPSITLHKLINYVPPPPKPKKIKPSDLRKYHKYGRLYFRHQDVQFDLNELNLNKIRTFAQKLWNQIALDTTNVNKFKNFYFPIYFRNVKQQRNFIKKDFRAVDFGLFFEGKGTEQTIFNHLKTVRLVLLDAKFIKARLLKKISEKSKTLNLGIFLPQIFNFEVFSNFLQELAYFLNLNRFEKKVFNENFFSSPIVNHTNRPFFMTSRFLKYRRSMLPTKFISDKSIPLSIARFKNQKLMFKKKLKRLKKLKFSLSNLYINFIKKNLTFNDLNLSKLNSNSSIDSLLKNKFSFNQTKLKNSLLNILTRLAKLYRNDKFMNLPFSKISKRFLHLQRKALFKKFIYKPKISLYHRKYNKTKVFKKQKRFLRRLRKKQTFSGLIARKLPEFLLNYKFLIATYVGNRNRYHKKKRKKTMRWSSFSKKYAYYFPFKFNLENFLDYYSGAKTLEPLNKESTVYASLPRLPYNQHVAGSFKKKFLNK